VQIQKTRIYEILVKLVGKRR